MMTQMDDFDVLNLVAVGTFGQVFRVRKKSGQDLGQVYAMKVVNKTGKSLDQFALSERTILEVARHPFIVDMVYAFQTSRRFHLVLNLCWGDFFDLQRKNTKISERFASFYMKETILAVQHLHDNDIIHRDIKPENILIDMNGHVKLTDFGTSLKIDETKRVNRFCGTMGYIAPEILSGNDYGKAVDWFSLGAVFYELLMRHPLFFKVKRYDMLKCLLEGKYLGLLNRCLSKPASDLISRLLRVKPSERLGFSGVKEIQDHSFFKKTRWDKVVNKLEIPPFIPSYVEKRNVTSANFFDNENVDEKPKPFYQEFDYCSSNLRVRKPLQKKSVQRFQMLRETEVPFYDRPSNSVCDCCQIL